MSIGYKSWEREGKYFRKSLYKVAVEAGTNSAGGSEIPPEQQFRTREKQWKMTLER